MSLACSGRCTHPCLLRPREASDDRIYSPIGWFFFSLIGMIGSWLAAPGLSPLKHLRLALRQLSSRTPAQLGAVEEGGTDRGASWNPGGKTVRWPNSRRDQKQQVCISMRNDSLTIIALTRTLKAFPFTSGTATIFVALGYSWGKIHIFLSADYFRNMMQIVIYINRIHQCMIFFLWSERHRLNI